MSLRKLALAAALALAPGSVAAAATEIEFWHSMNGAFAEGVAGLAAQFNASQSAYRVMPAFKGEYEQSMAAALAAVRSGRAPHIIEISDAGTAAMLAAKNAIRPVHQLMSGAGEKFDARAYVPALAGHYADGRGKLIALPFNGATAVFYYNKDAYRASGLDPEKAPQTWRDVQQAALKVQESGAAPCAFTTGWQSWVQVENLSAWHNQPFATRKNGFEGTDVKLNFNAELMIRHISLLSSWMKSGLFTYAGRRDAAEAKFSSGECAMLTSSSAAYWTIASGARFAFGVAPLPFYDEFKGAPFNTTSDGAGLWVMAGRKSGDYKGVARFLSFLSRPEVQAEWQRQTGLLPVTTAGVELARRRGFYKINPGADTPVKSLARATAVYSKGLRLGNLALIRAAIDEELEAVWNQTKTPKEALDAAVERGNELLRRFERAHKRRN
ncbi:MAG: sn-glycerol-3-phosphate ABC transporter substrate-binding protein UgpB [Betaproteobacteria bacterium]|nr:sn-glycerol-3-phosphate ABC transporter substrate-binding protein UgpB [Betaproteobacteria bacterium]